MSIYLQVSKPMMRDIHPAVAVAGNGVMDWFTSPWPGRPEGRYKVIEIQDHSCILEYEGPIP